MERSDCMSEDELIMGEEMEKELSNGKGKDE